MNNAHVLAFYRALALSLKDKNGPGFMVAIDLWEKELDNTLVQTNMSRRAMGLPEVLYKEAHNGAH